MATHRVILLGQSKGKIVAVPDWCRDDSVCHDRSALHPESSSGKNLVRILQITPSEYDDMFDRQNLYEVCDISCLNKRKVIHLGRNPLVVGNLPWFSLTPIGDLLIPHPSGLNRIWNCPQSKEICRNVVLSFVGVRQALR